MACYKIVVRALSAIAIALGLVSCTIAAQQSAPVTTSVPEPMALNWLIGEWKFTLGKQSGNRVYSITDNKDVLAWTETFDGLDVTGEGYISLSSDRQSIVTVSTHNRKGAFEVWQGQVRDEGKEILYKPVIAPNSQFYEILWKQISDDRFEYNTFELSGDNREKKWTAVFTRIEAPRKEGSRSTQ